MKVKCTRIKSPINDVKFKQAEVQKELITQPNTQNTKTEVNTQPLHTQNEQNESELNFDEPEELEDEGELEFDPQILNQFVENALELNKIVLNSKKPKTKKKTKRNSEQSNNSKVKKTDLTSDISDEEILKIGK
ncbi:Hypothetical_protein [Hexamita inflata]|uniref:Hypothetical_protein n=1 Tax=Hexamita inflata TaxID=28002 RepID=A0AA86UHC5_9EUKA|nr:Hypothetical protein HINF_LOCUS33817 [Hexamita inflata]CAI9951941.1 Hypothetical protein HINF_LOCUS39586 [Hexamita inflata]